MTEFLIEYDCTECKGDIPFIVGLSKTWCCEVCGGTGTLIVTEEYETTEDAIEDYPKYVSTHKYLYILTITFNTGDVINVFSKRKFIE